VGKLAMWNQNGIQKLPCPFSEFSEWKMEKFNIGEDSCSFVI
jgi:hypothetical protein